MLNYIIALLWFIGILTWDIRSDYKKWKNKKSVNHRTQWIVRVLLMSPSILLLSLPTFHIWKILAASFMISSIFWELFDGFYNKLRGFSWRFNGTSDPDDSWLDKFLYKLSPLQQMYLKWGLIIISILLYILI